jgi:hypothetical protein
LVDSQQVPAIPADGFKINGRLFSPAGEPAAGVRIHAVPVDATPPDVMWTTLSKDDGTYELTGLNPGRYRLETKSFAYDAVPTVFFGWAGSRGVDITLVAKDGGIRNSTGSGFAADALSDDERVIVQSQPRQFAPPSSPHEARAPRPKFDVTGSVISALLFPVAGAEVRLSSVAKGSVYVTRTNQQGEFLLPGVVAGNDYHLRIAAANNQHYARRRLRIGGDIVPIDVIMASAPTASLAGRVLDTQRNPVAGMPLLVTSSHGAGAAHRVTTDDDGRFAIARIAAGKILFLSHSLPNFRARGLTLHRDTRGEAELIVDRGERRVTGTVRQPRGQLLADSEVSLRWQTTRRGVTSYMVHNATTDRRGRFQFTGVGDGRHTLDARAAGIGSARRVVSIADLNDDVSVDLLP